MDVENQGKQFPVSQATSSFTRLPKQNLPLTEVQSLSRLPLPPQKSGFSQSKSPVSHNVSCKTPQSDTTQDEFMCDNFRFLPQTRGNLTSLRQQVERSLGKSLSSPDGTRHFIYVFRRMFYNNIFVILCRYY
jgi:hypothetical protein